jgi:hypothetical protein
MGLQIQLTAEEDILTSINHKNKEQQERIWSRELKNKKV